MSDRREVRTHAELAAIAPWVCFGARGRTGLSEDIARLKANDYGRKRTLVEWARALEPRAAWLRALDKHDQATAERYRDLIARNPWPEQSIGELRIAYGQERAAVSDVRVRDALMWARILTPGYPGQICDPGDRTGPARVEYEAEARIKHDRLTNDLDRREVLDTPLYILPILFSPGGAKTSPHRLITVNLTAPDSAIREAFDSWLRESRRMGSFNTKARAAGMRDIPTLEHGASTADMAAWSSDRLLAIVDYVLAARTVGKRATDAAIAKAIGVKTSAVQKSLRPRALSLVSTEVMLILRQQAGASLEAKSQPKKRPRGLSAKQKPRAV